LRPERLRAAAAGGLVAEGDDMSYVSTAEPIKLGYLFDFKLPAEFPQEMRDDLTKTFDLVFDEGLKQGIIDRPVQIVFREVEGLPKGSIKAVIDAFGELVDEGCLAVFGPAVTDNTVPTREAIEERFRVPAISITGAEEWLGEWTFALPMGSMSDEPIFWAQLLAKDGHTEVGVLVEQSLVGESYVKSFRRACRAAGVRIVAEQPVAQTAQDITDAVRKLHDAKAPAIVHCGFGFGVVQINPALAALGWDPPRYTGTAFQNAWLHPLMWNAFLGWTGVDQYDEANPVGQRFLDQYEVAYGRRPQYCVPVVNRDLATVLLHAFADAHPLTPRGVKEALERVRMLPAASGAPGTRLSFGRWTRRGWMGAGYLVARTLDPDGVNSHLVGRFGQD
jgi:branched-chain amino acid transport system substrate-binding protein